MSRNLKGIKESTSITLAVNSPKFDSALAGLVCGVLSALNLWMGFGSIWTVCVFGLLSGLHAELVLIGRGFRQTVLIRKLKTLSNLCPCLSLSLYIYIYVCVCMYIHTHIFISAFVYTGERECVCERERERERERQRQRQRQRGEKEGRGTGRGREKIERERETSQSSRLFHPEAVLGTASKCKV